jgi:hypothetical protein
VIVSLEITVFAYHRLNPWVWWTPVVVGLGAVVALGYPSRPGDEVHPSDDPSAEPEFRDAGHAGEQIREAAPGREPALL